MSSTFRELMVGHLIESGMSEFDADSVMRDFIEKDQMPEFPDWETDPVGYPPMMIVFIMQIIDKFAYKWPNAWYKDVFLSTEPNTEG